MNYIWIATYFPSAYVDDSADVREASNYAITNLLFEAVFDDSNVF